MRWRCVHGRVKDEGFRPDRRMKREYRNAVFLSSGIPRAIRSGGLKRRRAACSRTLSESATERVERRLPSPAPQAFVRCTAEAVARSMPNHWRRFAAVERRELHTRLASLPVPTHAHPYQC